MARIRSASIFLNNKRVAWMQSADESIKTGDTLEVTDGGVHPTDGTPMGNVSCQVLVPVAGTGFDIVKKALAHEDLKISFGVVDGSIHQYDARVEEVSHKTEVASGKLTGDWKFHIFNIQVTG